MRQRIATARGWMAVLLVMGMSGLGVACGPQPSGQQGIEYKPYERPDLQPLECTPNLDKRIAADELQPALGVKANYIVSAAGQTRQVDLAGRASDDGTRVWDWSARNERDQALAIAAEGLDEQWFADRFPDGEFALPIDLSGRTRGIYRTTDTRMLLLGIVSAEETPEEGQTFLKYDSPVTVYKFPIERGKEWVSVGEVSNGKIRGAPYAGRDTYQVRVSARGEMKLPSLTFEQVHRVDTKVTVQPAAGQSVVRRQVSFVAECFGEIARATSKDGEEDRNFSVASEVRRIGLN